MKRNSSLIAFLLLAASARLLAATDAWDGGNGATWADPLNWLTDLSAPGTGETATFNGAGNGNTVIDLGSGVTLGSLVFDTASAAGYTIGSGGAASQNLTLDAAGSIIANATVTNAQNIDANVILGGVLGDQAFTFTNNSIGGLTLAGAVTSNTTGIKTLTMGGTGTTTVSGNMTGGSGSLALVKGAGGGTVILGGTNDFSSVSFSGLVNAGVVGAIRVTSNNALGTAAISMLGQNATTQTLELANNVTISNNITSFSRDIGRAWIRNVSGNNTYNGNINITATGGGVTFESAGGKLTMAGSFTGTVTNREFRLQGTGEGEISSALATTLVGSITKTGTGLWTLSGNKTYTGNTVVREGTLAMTGSAFAGGSTGTAGGTIYVVDGSSTTNAKMLISTNVTSYQMFIGDKNNTASPNVGAVYQTAGIVNLTRNASIDDLRIGSNTNGQGYYSLSGGELRVNEIGVGASLGNTVGVMDMSAGTLTNSGWIAVGRGTGTSSGLLNITGGSATAARVHLNWAGTAGATSILNVGGGVGAASLSLAGSTTVGLDLGNSATAGTLGITNLRSNGTLTTGIVTASQASSVTHLNFNGGTLKAAATNAGANFMTSSNIDAVRVYSGGGTIDNSGTAITISKGLEAPTDSGVTTIAVTDGGSGYVGAPLVTLTGGTGSGATAYANMVDDGTGKGTYKIASITVTSAGVYTVAPTTVNLSTGGVGSVAATIGAITTVANVSGGMTFAGNGITTLSGASTYTGATSVSAGTLLVNGSLGNTAVTVSSGATLGGSNGTIGQTAATVNVLSGGTLAPGSSAGALTVNGDVTIGGTYAFEYDGGTSTADLLDVNGTLTLNDAILNLSDLTVNSYTVGDKFTLAAYNTLAGSLFTGYADDTEYTFNGGLWLFDYNDDTAGLNGGVGTNYITITAVPEPASMLLGGLGLLALLRRRRVS
jgi:autotransporter-associated beta strand protein